MKYNNVGYTLTFSVFCILIGGPLQSSIKVTEAVNRDMDWSAKQIIEYW